jgi:hypothetical protein
MEKRRRRRQRAVTRDTEVLVVSGLQPIRSKRYQRFARQVLSDQSGAAERNSFPRKVTSTAKE